MYVKLWTPFALFWGAARADDGSCFSPTERDEVAMRFGDPWRWWSFEDL